MNEVCEYFEKRKCLLIFDDAEKSEYLKQFLLLSCLIPDRKKPYILITSRDREWEKGIEVMGLCTCIGGCNATCEERSGNK